MDATMSSARGQVGETILGAVVAAVAVGFLAFAVTRAGDASASGGYELTARFDRIDGINVGSDVRLSGVKVGAVTVVELDPDTYLARIRFTLPNDVKIPDDSAVRVSTDGLLGGASLSVEPGGSPDMLAPGAEVQNTQGAIDLLTLISSMMGGGGSGSSSSEDGQ
jgi:phospholipid/cholesterol/gamma-HCH transport system substrate-binding protein